ncbi:MAG: DcaP family trimeric outer membrane transporter [Steroidobacteraceae bacterium]
MRFDTEASGSGVRLSVAAALAGSLVLSTAVARAEDAGRTFDIYGFAQADAIYDFQRMAPDWDDAFRPSKIANPEGEYGSNGQSSLSVKQSRFGIKGTMPTAEGYDPITFKFEFDLFGVGVDAGQTTFRLRYAYGEWGSLLAGQTTSVFMDLDVFPNVIDYWGPDGMVFWRNVQFRWTPYRTDTSSFAIAIEQPSNDVDPGQIREYDPELGSNIQGNEQVPNLAMHWRTSGDWGHVQVAGLLRDIGYDTKGTKNNKPKGSVTGWGVNLSGTINTWGKDRILWQYVTGDGIASYMNDGGVDLAPQGRFPTETDPGNVHAEAIPLTGIVAYYDHYWSEKFSTAFGYSTTYVDNSNLQDPDAYRKGQYTSVNLLYYPVTNVMVGGEVLWGDLENKDGSKGSDTRVQFSVQYKWGKTF